MRNSVPPPKKPRRLWLIVFVLTGIVILLVPVIWISKQKDGTQGNKNNQQAAPSFDKAQFSLEDPASPWVVVNKKRPLSPKTYAPEGLMAPNMPLKGNENTESMKMRPETAAALEALATAAQSEGIELVLVSAYRSHDTQKMIYDSEVQGFGQAVADTESARPGHSEHQTGWAVDLAGTNGECEIKACFADTPEGKWLAKNAHKYGFVIRYAKDKTDVTGYVYEPWHLRYVGPELAEEMHRTNTQTLEEFFDLPAAPSY